MPQCQYMVDNIVKGPIGEKTAKETVELYEMLGPIPNKKVQEGEGLESMRCK